MSPFFVLTFEHINRIISTTNAAAHTDEHVGKLNQTVNRLVVRPPPPHTSSQATRTTRACRCCRFPAPTSLTHIRVGPTVTLFSFFFLLFFDEISNHKMSIICLLFALFQWYVCTALACGPSTCLMPIGHNKYCSIGWGVQFVDLVRCFPISQSNVCCLMDCLHYFHFAL